MRKRLFMASAYAAGTVFAVSFTAQMLLLALLLSGIDFTPARYDLVVLLSSMSSLCYLYACWRMEERAKRLREIANSLVVFDIVTEPATPAMYPCNKPGEDPHKG